MPGKRQRAKEKEMLKKFGLSVMLAVAATGIATTGWAASQTAKIHGHVQDPLGIPLVNDRVLLSSKGTDIAYAFVTDSNGDYKGDGIAAGTYTIYLQKSEATSAPASGATKGNGNTTASATKSTPAGADNNSGAQKTTQGALNGIFDKQDSVKLPADADTQVDFDLSRQAYIDKLPPEVKKQIEDARVKNADILKQNTQIKNLNGLIQQARTARTAGNFDQAIALDQQATQAKPDAGLTWFELGASQLAAKKYDDAISNFKKSIELYQADPKTKPDLIASADNDLGECYAQTGKGDLALAAYEAAVKAEPTNAGMFYRNEAVVLFKAGQADAAGAAADKAITADPTKSLPYYIKGWSLVQNATVDPKTQKIILPPGCADAYQKFLSLAPDGPLADDARSILDSAGEKIHSTYKKK